MSSLESSSESLQELLKEREQLLVKVQAIDKKFHEKAEAHLQALGVPIVSFESSYWTSPTELAFPIGLVRESEERMPILLDDIVKTLKVDPCIRRSYTTHTNRGHFAQIVAFNFNNL